MLPALVGSESDRYASVRRGPLQSQRKIRVPALDHDDSVRHSRPRERPANRQTGNHPPARSAGTGMYVATTGSSPTRHLACQRQSGGHRRPHHCVEDTMDRLTADQVLGAGSSLASDDGSFTFVMQGDGNLVAYSADGHAWWASGTDGHPGAWVVLQNDGNLVVYDAAGSSPWASNTVQARRSDRACTVASSRRRTHRCSPTARGRHEALAVGAGPAAPCRSTPPRWASAMGCPHRRRDDECRARSDCLAPLGR